MTAHERLSVIEWVGPEAPVAVNTAGGKQSDSPYRMDLLPPLAALEVAGVLKKGAEKYGEDNWRRLSPREILNHAIVHLYAWLAGDRSDNHLSHAACRCLMALDLDLERRHRERMEMEEAELGGGEYTTAEGETVNEELIF